MHRLASNCPLIHKSGVTHGDKFPILFEYSLTQTVEKAFSLEEELISELKKHDRQKGEFTSMISHELKTPLVIHNI